MDNKYIEKAKNQEKLLISKIIEERKKQKITQKQIAKMIESSQAQYSKFEKLESRPNPFQLLAICNALNINPFNQILNTSLEKENIYYELIESDKILKTSKDLKEIEKFQDSHIQKIIKKEKNNFLFFTKFFNDDDLNSESIIACYDKIYKIKILKKKEVKI